MTPQKTENQELAPTPPAGTEQHAATPNAGRRKGALIAALAAVALAGAATTYAFTTRMVPAQNVLTFGSVKMEVIETEELADGTVQEVPANHEVKAESGVASRIVRFKNVGGSDMYVRARPVMSATAADGSERAGAEDVTDFKMGDSTSWVDGKDGWYYYAEPVAAADGTADGETTDALMTGIEFVGDFYDVPGPNGRFVFSVEAQAVQVDNNGTSALTAQGWPEEGAQN